MASRKQRVVHGTLLQYRLGCECQWCKKIYAQVNDLDWTTEHNGILECGVGMDTLCRVPTLLLAEAMITEPKFARTLHRMAQDGITEEDMAEEAG